MQKEYIVTGFGYSKDTNEPYSKALLLVQDRKNKDPKFGFLDSRTTFYTNDIRAIGSSIIVEISEVL